MAGAARDTPVMDSAPTDSHDGRSPEVSGDPADGSAASWASSPGVRSRMQLQRSEGTGPELALRRELHRMGLRYRVHWPVPGLRRRKIDIAFTRARLAVFVDGCYWHGCPDHGRSPIVNADYWVPKLARTRARDMETDQWLASVGWQTLRFWEHGSPASAAVDIARAYRLHRPHHA